jgi:hypothetical protein
MVVRVEIMFDKRVGTDTPFFSRPTRGPRMVLALLFGLFRSAPNASAPSALHALPGATPQRKTIILNSLVDRADEPNIIVLGSTGMGRGEAHVQTLKGGGKMEVLSDGSTITRNEAGEIVRTTDAVKCKREYAREEGTGELLVKRFGVWSKPQDARLGDNGTLYFTRDNVDVEERVNGLHIHTNKHTGVSIQTHHHNNFELVKLANGEIWKRETRREKEVFSMWNHGKLTFKSETYFSPIRTQADTPSGPQSLVNVSRCEQSWENGMLTRVKYTFTNATNGNKDVNLGVQLGTGMLSLKAVTQVLTKFVEGLPTETTYDLKTPAKLRVDIPNKRCQLSDIVRVRNFQVAANVGIAFDTKDNHEYIVFSGTRGLNNRTRAAESADAMDQLMEDGHTTADLVLR